MQTELVGTELLLRLGVPELTSRKQSGLYSRGMAGVHMVHLAQGCVFSALQRCVVQGADGKSGRVEHGPSCHP